MSRAVFVALVGLFANCSERRAQNAPEEAIKQLDTAYAYCPKCSHTTLIFYTPALEKYNKRKKRKK